MTQLGREEYGHTHLGKVIISHCFYGKHTETAQLRSKKKKSQAPHSTLAFHNHN